MSILTSDDEDNGDQLRFQKKHINERVEKPIKRVEHRREVKRFRKMIKQIKKKTRKIGIGYKGSDID